MDIVESILTDLVSDAFVKCNYSPEYGKVVASKTDFCQFQCNGALSAGKKYGVDPIKIAENVISHIEQTKIIKDITVSRPGFVNINLSDEYIADYCSNMLSKRNLGVKPATTPLSII